MEREQILKVMVPVGGFALLLVVVGAVIALNSGGPPPSTTTASQTDGQTPTPSETGSQGETSVGTGALDDSDLSRTMPSLTAPEWKDAGNPNVPGLKIWDVKEGTEDELSVRDVVMVHYVGWLTNGYSFDQSWKHGGPAKFSLSGVIGGWTYGLPGMKVGGIRRLYIPAKFAYGSKTQSDIPANSDLVFEVKLLRIFRSK